MIYCLYLQSIHIICTEFTNSDNLKNIAMQGLILKDVDTFVVLLVSLK